MLEKIKNLTSSTGEKGWPVAVKDRIAYHEIKEANCAVTFLWTIRDDIIPNLDKENLEAIEKLVHEVTDPLFSTLVGLLISTQNADYLKHFYCFNSYSKYCMEW